MTASVGLRPSQKAGNFSLARLLFQWRGGQVMKSRLHSPRSTASSLVAIWRRCLARYWSACVGSMWQANSIRSFLGREQRARAAASRQSALEMSGFMRTPVPPRRAAGHPFRLQPSQ